MFAPRRQSISALRGHTISRIEPRGTAEQPLVHILGGNEQPLTQDQKNVRSRRHPATNFRSHRALIRGEL
jgi:hypothetical protein